MLLGGALAPPDAEGRKQRRIARRDIEALAAAPFWARARGAGRSAVGRQLAHRYPPLAAIDGPHLGSIAETDERSAVIEIFAQEPFQHQLIDEVAPRKGADLATDPERGEQPFASRLVLHFAQQVIDDAPAT